MFVKHIKSGVCFEQSLMGDYLLLEGIKGIKGQFRINKKFRHFFEEVSVDEIEDYSPIDIRKWRRDLVYYIFEDKKAQSEKEEALAQARAEALNQKREDKNENIITLDFTYNKKEGVKKEAPRKGKAPKRDKAPITIKSSEPQGEMVDVKYIADILNLPPTKVRQKLRKHYIKPDGGWKWLKSEVEEVINKIK